MFNLPRLTPSPRQEVKTGSWCARLLLFALALTLLPSLVSAQTGQVPSGGYNTFPVNKYISPNLQNGNGLVVGRWVVYNSSGAIASNCYSGYSTNGWDVQGTYN